MEFSEKDINIQMDELTALNKRLKLMEKRYYRASKLAKVGNWTLDLSTMAFEPSMVSFNLIGVPYTPSFSLKTFRSYVLEEYYGILDAAFEGLLKHNEPYDVAFRLKRPDNGEIVYFHSVAEIIYDENDVPITILGAIHDVTEARLYELDLKDKNKKLSELYKEVSNSQEELLQQLDELKTHKDLLQISTTKYQTLMDHTQDAIYSVDNDGVFTAVNLKFCRDVGLVEHEVVGKKMEEFLQLSQAYLDKWYHMLQQVTEKKEVINYEQSTVVEDHTFYANITLSPIINRDNMVVGITGINHDVTTFKDNEKKIRRMSLHDPLTDLPNRTLFFDRLSIAINHSKRMKKKIAVLYFDMDNFKRINDTLGHYIGDKLLVEASLRLQACMRDYDTVARLSGDEFAVVLQDISGEEIILKNVNRIKKVMNQGFLLEDKSIHLTTSIGIAIYPEDGSTPEELLRHADTAMYKAKESGKNAHLFFDFEMREQGIKQLEIESLLKKAIQEKEFVLHYQPQFRANKGGLRGFEALIRWNSPELGMVAPNDFISISEETGLINPIGQWVIDEACGMLKRMQDRYHLSVVMSINVSIVQLRQEGFELIVQKILASHGLDPSAIELEITEGIFIDNLDVALEVISKLKNIGVGIALDDFGTGYSSLSYLKKIPISLLKIDKAFVDEIQSLYPENDLTEPIISLVHKLGIETIAEGIEAAEQLEYLTRVGCDNFQGYYLGRPVAEEEAEAFIKKEVSQG